VQTKGVGNPVGNDAAVETGQGVAGDAFDPVLMREGSVVVSDDADEDTGPTINKIQEGILASSASQASSSISRCCGSIDDASRGLMPKNLRRR
jgi:hypothetical protein